MIRNAETKMLLLAFSSAVLVAAAGCDNKQAGSAQSAGQQVGQAADKMGQQLNQAADQAKDQAAKAGKAIDDTAITAAVKAEILAEPGLKVLQIDVETKDGKVTLTGSADSAESVKKAEQIASNVSGVKGVENRLVVAKS
jgi:hyperosmotically inducible protein